MNAKILPKKTSLDEEVENTCGYNEEFSRFDGIDESMEMGTSDCKDPFN
jgi:hypothetical protein